jgi:hypothetical protein
MYLYDDARYALAYKTRYDMRQAHAGSGADCSKMLDAPKEPEHGYCDPPASGLLFLLVFRAEPGRKDVLLGIVSSCEAAPKRRIPPPAFGPLPMSPYS